MCVFPRLASGWPPFASNYTDKTELIWTGSKASLPKQGRCRPALQLGHDSIAASDHVRLLGATISSDFSLDRHVANVSSTGFYWLRQLQRIRRSLDMDSATTLVHAFVSSCVDYCNILLAFTPKVGTDRLQRVMNAAARVLSSTHKYDRGLSRLLHSELHWLDVPERVQYKLCVTMYSCLHGQSLRYLAYLCVPVSDVSARQYLRSATRRLLVVPRCQLSTLGPRAFSVAGPSLWNSLPDSLRDPDLGRDNFRRLLKTHLYCTEAFSVLEMFQDDTLYKLTYLLTKF